MSTKESNYREKIGFTNQQILKSFFKGLDCYIINEELLKKYNRRLEEIFEKINSIIPSRFRDTNLANRLNSTYNIIKDNKIVEKLTNQGRSPEHVYYNWMRGYLVCECFKKSFAHMFSIKESELQSIGEDDLTNPKTFKRTAKADLGFIKNQQQYRLEIQSGFTGVNDVKETKINEALKRKAESNIITFVIHIDLFNGAAAIIDINSERRNIIQWDKRKAFEDSTVYSIPKSKFTWNITENPPVILH